jgi:general secretion pathway protein A
MYEQFYGFREKPFSLTPDPAFLYLSKRHAVALSMLEYGLANRAGISVMTGDIGAGKTTLVRRLLEGLGSGVTLGLISNTHPSFGNLLQWVSGAFGLVAESASPAILHQGLVTFLVAEYAHRRRVVLVVDEAQNLDTDTLEELRLLSNLNADKHLVLQIMLIGQPELRHKLRSPGLAQFVQRIGVDFHLGPLLAEDTDAYVRHRLNVAGSNSELFTRAAVRFIHYQTGGVPRLINSLCDTALVYGFADSRPHIGVDLINDLICERILAGLFGTGLVEQSHADPAQQLVLTEQNRGRALDECGTTGELSI